MGGNETPDRMAALGALRDVLARALPLVDELADGLRALLLALVGTVLLTAGLLWWRHDLSGPWLAALTVLGLSPALVLGRLWLALEGLKGLPAFLRETAGEVGEELAASLSALRRGGGGRLNVVGQARRLWALRGLLDEAGDLLRESFSVGVLLNPAMLLLGVLALLATGLVILLAAVALLVLW